MKNQTLLIGLFLFVTSCQKNNSSPTSNCIPGDLAINVIAFYPFSNGSTNDMSGNNHHLVNSTTAKATIDRDGNLKCAYEFVNNPISSEFLTTSNPSFLDNLPEFSVSLWYEPLDTTRNDALYECLVNRDVPNPYCADRRGQWSIGLYDCRKAVFGRTNSVWDHNITNFDCHGEIIVRTNSWSHLVVTFKQSGIEMKIYRNGILQNTSTGDGACQPISPAVQDIGDLFFGKTYTGKLDDVIIFNKVLTDQEVTTLFNMKTCCD